MTQLPLALLGSLFALSLGLAGCSQAEPEVPPPVRVLSFTVGDPLPGSDASRVPADQPLHPMEDPREARAELDGRVLEVLVSPGQSVAEGQALVRIDPSDARLADSSAQVQARAARAQLANAEADYARFLKLRKEGFISEAEIERRAAQLTVARAEYEAQLDRLGLITRRALASGTVRSVAVKPGQVVAAGQMLVFLKAPAPRAAPVLKSSASRAGGAGPGGPEGLMVPLSAIQDGKAVMRLEPLFTADADADSTEPLFKAIPQPVTLGEVSTASAAVLEGLAKGQQIVRMGGHLLTDGQVVRLAP